MTRTETATVSLLLLMLSACAQAGIVDRGGSGSNPAQLADTAWIVDQLGTESGAVLRGLTLTFVGGGRINGQDGCNAFSGDVLVGESTIHISDKLMGTMVACPDAVESRARDYRAALVQATRYHRDNAKLNLTDATGTVLLTLAPAPTSLAGSSWEALSYNNGKQAVVSLIIGTKITARFGEDGRITGNAGCNAYFAAYTVAGPTIAIYPPGATRRACAGSEGLMEQETLYLQALATATEYRISGNRLELRNTQGALVAIFVREGG